MADVTLNLEGVNKKVSRISTDPTFGLWLATEAMRGMEQYVPFRNGYLSASAVAEPFSVSYSTSYAGAVYYGKKMNFSKERHANACAEWDKSYAAAHGSDLARAATAYLRR